MTRIEHLDPPGTAVPIADPSWSLMPYEAKELIKSLDKLVKGDKLAPSEHGKFFAGLKARLAATCKHHKNPGGEHACSEAIDLLLVRSQRREPSELTYVDKELIGTLRRMLKKATFVMPRFDRTMTPKFSLDTVKDLRSIGASTEDLTKLLGDSLSMSERHTTEWGRC